LTHPYTGRKIKDRPDELEPRSFRDKLVDRVIPPKPEEPSSITAFGSETNLTDILTARGDILTRDATGYKRLPIGAATQVLTVDAGGDDPEWAASAGGGGSSIKVGTYTGDGALSQAITGVGFQPEFLIIMRIYGTETFNHYTGFQLITKDMNWITHVVQASDWLTDKIIAFGADGFTVDDDTTDQDPNTNGQSYAYIAMRG
jgi:hypothetical protein